MREREGCLSPGEGASPPEGDSLPSPGGVHASSNTKPGELLFIPQNPSWHCFLLDSSYLLQVGFPLGTLEVVLAQSPRGGVWSVDQC